MPRVWKLRESVGERQPATDPKELERALERLQRGGDLLEEINAPILALLGEPGIGKSTEIKRACAVLTQLGIHARVINLRSRNATTLLSHVQQDAELARWKRGAEHLTLFLDSLDEGLLLAPELADVLVDDVLPSWPLDRLRLRIGCRTGAWPTHLGTALESCWKVQNLTVTPLQIADLQPLDRLEIQSIAKSKDAPKDFVDQVDDRNVWALAVRPVTLELLLKVACQKRSLPESRRELYEQGLALVVSEYDEGRRRKFSDRINPKRMLHVAGRIATALFLSGRAGVAEPYSDDTQIPLGDLVGQERDEAGDFPVEEPLLRKVLRESGLFSCDSGHFTFHHQTWAEFLAARYLHHAGIEGSKALAPLQGQGHSRIAPPLTELAGWIAAQDPGALKILLENDPMVLLHTDPAVLSNDARAQLSDTLLKMYQKKTLVDDFWKDRFVNLKHPGLADQLRPYLVKRGDLERSFVVRRVACRIAQETRLTELVGELLHIARDPSDHPLVRRPAVYAAAELEGDSPDLEIWRALAAGGCGLDEDGELRGTALRVLWPKHLSASELVAILEAKDSPMDPGPVRSFLNHHLLPGLDKAGPAYLATLLRWAAQHNGEYEYKSILEELYRRAWRTMEHADVFQAMVETFPYRRYGFRFDPELREPAFDLSRRRYLEALVSAPDAPPSRLWHIAHQERLLLPRDFDWAWDRLIDSKNISERENWRDALRLTFDSENPSQLQRIETIADDHPALAALLRWELDDPGVERVRKHAREVPEEEPKKLDPPPVVRVQQAIGVAQSQPDHWIRVIQALTLTDTSTHYGDGLGNHQDLPGWQSASPFTRQQILDLAEQFLHSGDPAYDLWFGKPNISGTIALYATKAIAILATERPASLESVDWPRWGMAVMEYASMVQADHSPVLMDHVNRRAGDTVRRAIRQLLETATDEHHYSDALYRAGQVWNHQMGTYLMGHVEDPNRDPALRALALERLAHHAPETSSTLIREVGARPETPPALRALALFLMAATQGHTLETEWWEWVATDEDVIGRLLGRMGSLAPWQLVHVRLDQLPAAILQRMYHWIQMQPMGTEAARSYSFRLTTPADNLRQLSGFILATLQQRASRADLAALEAVGAYWHLQEAQRKGLERAWQPIAPRELWTTLGLLARESTDGTTSSYHMPPACSGHYDFFLVHASPDKPQVEQWFRSLTENGFRVFLDKNSQRPGGHWDHVIPAALQRSRIVLVFTSAALHADGWYARSEIIRAIALARKQGTMLVRICLDGTLDLTPYGLEQIQYIDMSEVPYETAVQDIITLANDLHMESAATGGVVQPPVANTTLADV
jgi:TIR domain